jgi:fumarylacetoacetate (FAA) hydrolase
LKLATIQDGTADGRLVVVARDHEQVVVAGGIARTLQEALDRWDSVLRPLQALYDDLNAGVAAKAVASAAVRFMAPLPRAWQWLDASAFPQHGILMAKAFDRAPVESEWPLMYQGLSHLFHGPTDDIPFVAEADDIDFEGELGVITGLVPMGASRAEAAASIRLAVLINDWSLRRYAPLEMKTGFGWILAKPACSMAPIAITTDELGSAWQNQRIIATLLVERDGNRFGAVPATEMAQGFDELISHAARTRPLCAGTLLGSGTVSHSRHREVGSCCISERRAIEMIDHDGVASTPYLHFGERVRMLALGEEPAPPLFGVLNQRVVGVSSSPMSDMKRCQVYFPAGK